MPCNGIVADLLPIAIGRVLVAGTGNPVRARVRVRARRVLKSLLHRLQLLLLLPKLLLRQELLRMCRRNWSHCHCAAGARRGAEGG